MTVTPRDAELWSEVTRGRQIWLGRQLRNSYSQVLDRMRTCPPESNAESCSSACWMKESTTQRTHRADDAQVSSCQLMHTSLLCCEACTGSALRVSPRRGEMMSGSEWHTPKARSCDPLVSQEKMCASLRRECRIPCPVVQTVRRHTVCRRENAPSYDAGHTEES